MNMRARRRSADQHAFLEVDQAACLLGGLGVVGDHDDRLPDLVVEAREQPQDLLRGHPVEVAGRLVGDDQRRIGDQRPRDRDPLLLPARQLVGKVRRAVGQADELEGSLDALAALGARQRRQLQRQLDVAERRQHRHQVVELEDESDVHRAPQREIGVREARDVDAADADLPGRRLVDAGDEVQQRRLARSRGPHQRDELALEDVEIEIDQYRDHLVAADVVLRQAVERDQRLPLRRVRRGLRGSACLGTHPTLLICHSLAAPRFPLSWHSVPIRLPPIWPSRRPAIRSATPHPASARPCHRTSRPRRSPFVAPGVTGTASARPSRSANTTLAPLRWTIASVLTASSGFSCSGVTSCERKLTLALISGRMRGSIASNFTLVVTVALARSTVGTMRSILPRKRASGSASSRISARWPTLTFPRIDSETSASTSSVDMSAMVTTAPLESVALENGVNRSPTLALLDRMTPSKGARILV